MSTPTSIVKFIAQMPANKHTAEIALSSLSLVEVLEQKIADGSSPSGELWRTVAANLIHAKEIGSDSGWLAVSSAARMCPEVNGHLEKHGL